MWRLSLRLVLGFIDKWSEAKVIIKRMGFKIIDVTASQWILELLNSPDSKTTVSHPKDFAKDAVNTHVLANLKVKGELGLKLLDESLVRAMDKLLLNVNQ